LEVFEEVGVDLDADVLGREECLGVLGYPVLVDVINVFIDNDIWQRSSTFLYGFFYTFIKAFNYLFVGFRWQDYFFFVFKWLPYTFDLT
jgi:8-oxo-dGTP pyrophosphatase MutT (NUDIX family)